MISLADSAASSHRASKTKTIPFTVIASSSHSPGYLPEYIMDDRPSDQSSRWSSASNDQFQYLILKVSRPAILNSITFGKFHKNHVCNLREFKVLVKNGEGLDEGWIEVLHSGLRNDNEPETFPLVYPRWHGSGESSTWSSDAIPVSYIKIIPLAAWGNSFNYSIWYVELHGVDDVALVSHVNQQYHERLQAEAWRLCLKFLRSQPGMEDTQVQLANRIGISLEDPLVTMLYEKITKEGNFTAAEAILESANQINPSLFNEYLQSEIPYEAKWTRLSPNGPNGNSTSGHGNNRFNTPSMRGGHQMCWDPQDRCIYLLGGWDGTRDLGDFWYYDVASATWTCLSEDTRREGGPGPRSCHKIILHSALRRLYVFGKYVDTETRQTGITPSDFYYYDLTNHTWTLVCEDTSQEDGPGLVYDHQMAIDEEHNMIYVFGGRQIHPSPPASTTSTTTPNETIYSGLYSYSIDMATWQEIRSDISFLPNAANIKSRIGHSMLMNPKTRQLIIYAGQRHKDYLSDFYLYDIDEDEVVELVKDTSKVGGPEAGFTQRCTLDVAKQEIFLFSGLMRDRNSSFTTTNSSGNNSNTTNSGNASQGNDPQKNSLWIYNLLRKTWSRIKADDSNEEEPCPRFAHQLVYDEEGGIHYLFGGNPGEGSNPRRRLDDFWSLRLYRQYGLEDILRRARFLIRRQRFYEMCWARRLLVGSHASSSTSLDARPTPAVNPMHFLQNDLSQVVNHANAKESREFRQLSAWLLNPPSMDPLLQPTAGSEAHIAAGRRQLLADLVALLPRHMQPPALSLTDLVTLQ